MREILFRGKRLDNGDWVYGSLMLPSVWDLQNGGDNTIIADQTDSHCYTVDAFTVGQYTGLTDKNGVKIFEGDILLTTNPNCKIWYVDYKPTAFCANQSNVNYSCILDEFVSSFEAEVIGSIHDNPELLKEES